MSVINVVDLTFAYEGSYNNIFENVSFRLDTDWRLGLIGRNGRGKTTFLKLLMNEYEYTGKIISSVEFEYFPPIISNVHQSTLEVLRKQIADFDEMERLMDSFIEGSNASMEQYSALLEQFMYLEGYSINELIKQELRLLDVKEDVLNRPFSTLSGGERTKCLLAAMFLKKDNFLLIDEPTNHLDYKGREIISQYLQSKKAFILVSHDRRFLDQSIDHVLSINKADIELQKGNYTTWKENRDKSDAFELDENRKLKKDISRLNSAAKQAGAWSDKIEKSKIGDHSYDRGFIGHKAAKMMKRSKSIERRKEEAATEKQALLKNIETTDQLKLSFLEHHSKLFIKAENLSLYYGKNKIIDNISFSLSPGERLAIKGINGCGKTSLIKLIMGENIDYTGSLFMAHGLKFSYVSQETAHLKGNLKDYCQIKDIDESLFKAILRKMGYQRSQFDKSIENFSEGQKKKLLIASSLCQKTHFYIWDEPLNYVDIISRLQIEELIIKYKPTMVFVEHDTAFSENIATDFVQLSP